MDDRRRATRQSAVWLGRCQVEGEPAHVWLDCGVFDFSTLGVGMDFRHADAPGLVGRRLSVRLPVGDSIDMTLTGEVRNAKAGPGGIARVGIEFVDLSEEELYIVDLLEVDSVSSVKL
jgi:PilZ domain